MIPPTVITIWDYEFRGCTSLSSITIPPTVTTISNGLFHECSSLIYRSLSTTLISVSASAFDFCPKLCSIIGPSFSTTSLGKNASGFKDLLVEAGLSPDNPDIILEGRPQARFDYACMYYDHKVWARNKDLYGRLPIVTAVAKSLKWTFISRIC